jgi:hypothetical protein
MYIIKLKNYYTKYSKFVKTSIIENVDRGSHGKDRCMLLSY